MKNIFSIVMLAIFMLICSADLIAVQLQNQTGHDGVFHIRLRSTTYWNLNFPSGVRASSFLREVPADTWQRLGDGSYTSSRTGFLGRVSFTIPGYNGVYDVRMVTHDGQIAFGKNGISIDENVTLTPSDKYPALAFQNNTPQQIYVNFPSSTATISNTNVGFSAGESRTFQLFDSNNDNSHRFQYRIGGSEYREGDIVYDLNMVIVSDTNFRFPRVNLVNNTGNTVNRVFIRHQNQNEWGENYTSTGIINSDSWSVVFFDFRYSNPEKLYDIRIDDVNGNAYVKRGIRISEDIDLRFSVEDMP